MTYGFNIEMKGVVYLLYLFFFHILSKSAALQN